MAAATPLHVVPFELRLEPAPDVTGEAPRQVVETAVQAKLASQYPGNAVRLLRWAVLTVDSQARALSVAGACILE